jgi:ketosteroid isomerase-like protein
MSRVYDAEYDRLVADDSRQAIRSVAERYLELASAGDTDAIAELYAEDAIFVPAQPPEPRLAREVRGREAIRRHYRDHVASRRPRFTKLEFILDPPHCVVEIEAETVGSDAPVHIVDVFTIADGRIARMAAYRRAES